MRIVWFGARDGAAVQPISNRVVYSTEFAGTIHLRRSTMGKCLKGKSEVDKDEAKYACKKCGARTDNKEHVCKPKKVKKGKDKKDQR
jgi:hypothetical protein